MGFFQPLLGVGSMPDFYIVIRKKSAVKATTVRSKQMMHKKH
jgi:hypothetical protein